MIVLAILTHMLTYRNKGDRNPYKLMIGIHIS